MTKNQFKAYLKLLTNLRQQEAKVRKMILKEVPEPYKDLVANTVFLEPQLLQSMERKLISGGAITASEEDAEVQPIEISVDSYEMAQITKPVRGGSLIAYTSVADAGTDQAGVMYKTEDECLIDLCMAEVKGGELAEVSGLAPENKDPDLYVYGDVYQEDYTEKIHIPWTDINSATHGE